MKQKLLGYAFPIAIVVVAVVMMMKLGGGTAATPQAFADAMTLDQAAARAEESGKPVLVFATADWCAPCQRFKRTALADEQVNAAILEHTEPVYLDLTDARTDPEAAAAAQRMGVQAIPSLVLLRDNQVVAKRGAMGAEELISWLKSN